MRVENTGAAASTTSTRDMIGNTCCVRSYKNIKNRLRKTDPQGGY